MAEDQKAHSVACLWWCIRVRGDFRGWVQVNASGHDDTKSVRIFDRIASSGIAYQ